MEWISSQKYYEVERKIENQEQLSIEIERSLFLSDNKIITSNKQFSLQQVLDISCRILSEEFGWLYLHTNQGVFSFRVKTNPHHFINEFKKLK